MSQAEQAPRAAPPTPGDEKHQKLQALGKALLDEERLRLLGLLAHTQKSSSWIRTGTDSFWWMPEAARPLSKDNNELGKELIRH